MRSESRRILLAEDNEVNSLLATALLEKRGHEVVVAVNGKEAVAAFEQGAFDLILMDVQMPEMDGVEATAAIRERESGTGSHIPIVAVTAHAMNGDREQFLAAGMDAYLAKPIRAAELLRVIDQVLGGRSSEVARSRIESLFDRSDVLQRVGGDRVLLGELVDLFYQIAPEMMGRIREAISRRDACELEQAAHALKGSVGNFSAVRVHRMARNLELSGREGDFDGVAERCAQLEAELERLHSALRTFADEPE